MTIALPSGWLKTVDAAEEMIAAHPTLQRANENLKADEATLILLAAITAGELAPVFLLDSNGGHQPYEIPRDYWTATNADVAIYTGGEHGFLGLARDDTVRLRGAPICFRRTEWDPWFRQWKMTHARQVAQRSDEDAAYNWLCGEMARRAQAGESRTRDGMVIVLGEQFPDIGERKARALYKKLPAKLKGRPGRRSRINAGQK